MKRSQRLDMVQRVVDDQERGRAQALAGSERRLTETESKLRELQSYREGYLRDFSARAAVGMDGTLARDYQAFLLRLEEALRQQTQLVVRARAQRDGELRSWQGAAQRAEAVGRMLNGLRVEEARELDRREQNESDERSQRAWADGMALYGT